MTVGASGAAGSPITIAVDAANTSPNGTVIFDYNQFGDNATVKGITCSLSYVTFNGNVGGQNHIQINNLRNTTSGTTSIGFYSDSTTGVVVDHLTFINNNNPVRFLYP